MMMVLNLETRIAEVQVHQRCQKEGFYIEFDRVQSYQMDESVMFL